MESEEQKSNNIRGVTDKDPKSPKDVNTSKHATRYFFVGLGITLFNYALFAIISNILIDDNNLLWLSNLIATALTTIVAYIAHSQITWKERHVTKAAIIRFFIWNALLAFLIAPSLTQLFGMLTHSTILPTMSVVPSIFHFPMNSFLPLALSPLTPSSS